MLKFFLILVIGWLGLGLLSFLIDVVFMNDFENGLDEEAKEELESCLEFGAISFLIILYELFLSLMDKWLKIIHNIKNSDKKDKGKLEKRETKGGKCNA